MDNAREEIAVSTVSIPASIAFSKLAVPIPLVEWVCKLNRYAKISFQRRDEFKGSVWGDQPCHIFDADRISAKILEVTPHPDKCLDTVDGADGVADRGLNMAANPFGNFHRITHVTDVIQRIENSKYIDPVPTGTNDEFFDNIVGIMLVTYNILSSEKHLKRSIGHCFFQDPKPLPRIFAEKSHRRVEGRATPHLHGPVSDFIEKFGDLRAYLPFASG